MSFSENIAELVLKSDRALIQKANHWERVPLLDVAQVLNGFAFKSAFFNETNGVPLIRIRDVTSGTVKTLYDGEVPDGYWVEPGDLIIGMDGDFNSRLWTGPRALLNQRVCKVTPDLRFMDIRFLHAVLPGYLQLINDHTSAVTVKHLSSRTLGETPIPLPSLTEQKRIVKKLDTLSVRFNKAHADLQAIPALAERYKLNYLRSVFRGEQTGRFREENDLDPVSMRLEKTAPPEQGRGGRQATDEIIPGKGGISVNNPGTELPEGWSWVPLLRVARQETGHTPSRSHPEWWGGDVRWISIPDANTHHGRVINDTVQKTNEEGLANSSARLLPEGTVALSRTASVGYVTIMGREMATSQDFATWSCNEALEPKYLMYALMSEGDDIRDFGKGTTHTTIYFPEIRAFNIKLAPLEEQREIVRRVEAAFGMVERLAAEAEKALNLTDRLGRRILAKAFAGELVPQDPIDEPASVVLERIKVEKKEREKTVTEARKTKPARISEPRRAKLTDLLDVLKQQKSWISTTKAARGLGLGDGTSSDDIEAFYHQLKKYVESSAIEVERRDDEDWLRLADVEAN
ncbi:restriction endonuclease subunit S [Tritonibacter mobilis]|uniref:restriction endonuclease subunit S n=1 Tax=Tritonibacter mobilis TaxID=379347 RepID=UPI000806E4AD|nr:restriction endonuclease subunit S [Tritonibacter mobilis]